MIGLIASTIWARRAQAVTLFLLAAVAVAAAVAGPVATRATDAAVVRLEVAHAADRELALQVFSFADPTNPQSAADFDQSTRLAALPGFELIRGGELTTFGPVLDPAELTDVTGTRLAFRDRVCENVTILSGRCLAGAPEVIVGEQTAARAGIAAGDLVTVQASTVDENGSYVPDGAPRSVTVVGIYRPLDYDGTYWAGRRYFPITADGTRDETVFTNVATMALTEHTFGVSYVDSLAPPSILTPSRVWTLRQELLSATNTMDNITSITVSSQLPELLDRIEHSRGLAGQLGPVAFIPLTAISLFVIYLAVGYGVFGRRGEIGLVALRGVRTWRRWLLAGGEAVVPILLGAPAGYVLGHVGVGLVARSRLGSADGTALSYASIPFAAAALVVALVVALLGQRRALREPVVELLRGVPRGAAVWQVVAVEALVGALAVVATVQLRISSGGVTGLGLLVPGLLVVAVALLAARAFVPVAGLVARFSLRRGLLGAGLAAVQLARRPGSQRLFVLLSVGTAMLAFVAAGTDVAGRAREDRAVVATGASRVLQVEGTDARRLLAATEELDPAGEWAMAAMVLQPTTPRDPTVLALDTSRLATVAAWRSEFGADPAAVAAALAPTGAEPLAFTGTELEVDAEVSLDSLSIFGPAPVIAPLTLEFDFVTVASGTRVTVPVPDLPVGHEVVTVPVLGCEEGCRLVGIANPNAQFGARLRLRSLRGTNGDVIPTSALNRARWRSAPGTTTVPTAQGLTIMMEARGFLSGGLRASVLDSTLPVPVAATDRLRVLGVPSLDHQHVDAQQVMSLTMLPRLGTEGVLADLRYLEQTVLNRPAADASEIWLGPGAPADAVEQFRGLGIAVVGESTVAQARETLARQGPALALQFHLAAALFGMLLALGGLGLVAAVDRRSRAADLRALRVQGLPRRVSRRAALWGYLALVVLAAVAGLAGAVVAWVAAGDRLPVFTDAGSVLAPPRWPAWPAVVQPWAVATAALAVAAVLAAWALRRAVTRPPSRSG